MTKITFKRRKSSFNPTKRIFLCLKNYEKKFQSHFNICSWRGTWVKLRRFGLRESCVLHINVSTTPTQRLSLVIHGHLGHFIYTVYMYVCPRLTTPE